MDLFLCWLLGPALVLLVALGLSFGLELISGHRAPWAVRPALGLAAAMVLAQAGVMTDLTAELALPLIAALGVLGLALGWRAGLSDEPLPGWSLAAAAGVYLVYGAPVILSGDPTWAGYIKLDDTATWMALTDHAFEFGPRVTGFELSTYEALVDVNAGEGYPIGAFVPMALIGKLVGQDLAWTVQPSMALLAASLALMLAELTRPLIKREALRAAVAFLGAQSALLLGYSLWGGTKEVAAAAILALGPLAAGYGVRATKEGGRGWLAPGLVAAAFLSILGLGGVVWLVPTVVPMLWLANRELGGPATVSLGLKTAALGVAATLPQIIPHGYFSPLQAPLLSGGELGNLRAALNPLQAVGVWPALDFRDDPQVEIVVSIVCLALLAAAALAVRTALREREIALPSYVVGGVAAAVVAFLLGSAWIDAKAMAIVSPALLMAGLAGIALIGERTRFNLETWFVGTVVVFLIGWSTVLAFQGTWLAPYDEHRELEQIGEDFEGDGPALMVEGSSYGPRHFLRKLDAENPKDLRRRRVALRDGSLPDEVPYLDVEMIDPAELAPYNLLVFRRSPAASRPDIGFTLAYEGKHYEVWRRRAASVSKQAHLPLGSPPLSFAEPDCAAVERLAEAAGADGIMLAARPRLGSLVSLAAFEMPPEWRVEDPQSFQPEGTGELRGEVNVPAAGDYELWVGGYIFGGLQVSVGGQAAPAVRHVISGPRYHPFGPFSLEAGPQPLEISYEESGWHPGGKTGVFPLGPLVLQADTGGDPGTTAVEAARYQELCGQPWDWIEAL